MSKKYKEAYSISSIKEAFSNEINDIISKKIENLFEAIKKIIIDEKLTEESLQTIDGSTKRQQDTNYIPVTKWGKYHDWPSEAGMRYLIFNRKTNGLDNFNVIKKVGYIKLQHWDHMRYGFIKIAFPQSKKAAGWNRTIDFPLQEEDNLFLQGDL